MSSAQEEDVDSARSVNLRGLGPNPGWKMVYWWVSVRTVGAGSGLQVDGAATDPLGSAVVMSSDGATRTIDGSIQACKSGTWLLKIIDDTSAFTVDIGYFSPFSDLRYDYQIHVTDIFQV